MPLRPPSSATIVVGTALGVLAVGTLPPFLMGTLAPFVRRDIPFGEAQLGILLLTYIGVSAALSVPAGHLVERVGAAVGMWTCITATVVALVGASLFASSWSELLLFYAAGGLGQSMMHPSANLAIFRAIPSHRLGLAYGVKQAAIPTATLVAGLAVPLATTAVSWRSVFLAVAAAGVFVASIARWSWTQAGAVQVAARGGHVRMKAPSSLLTLTLGCLLAGAAVQPFTAFFVTSAVAGGADAGRAGTAVAVGGLLSVVVRVSVGATVDRSDHLPALRVVTMLMAAGGIALAAIGIFDDFWVEAVAVTIGIGIGWSWNGLVPYAVSRLFPETPAAAMGYPQAGLLAGAAIGPVIFGILAEGPGFDVAWGTCAALMGGAMLLVARGRRGLEQVPPVPAERITKVHGSR